MRIVYDGIIYAYQATGGISRYFSNLISHLPGRVLPSLILAKKRTLSFPVRDNLHVRALPGHRWPKPLRGLGTWVGRKLGNSLYESGDILHPTYYSLLSGQNMARQSLPVVLTVFDMIQERLPRISDPDGAAARVKGNAIRAAQAIICISNKTKEDLLEFYRVPEAKVSVVHLASEMGSVLPSTADIAPPAPYFLYVGSRAAYKNFLGLLRAMAIVAERRRDAVLCVVGEAFHLREMEQIRRLGLADRILNRPFASDAELSRLYRGSVALVYPSLYEGFGIPPLEAMCCGSAVLASDCSSIPEVVGDAALLFDPQSVEAMADAMFQVLDNTALRTDLIQKGLLRSKHFSWQKTADQTMTVYDSVLQQRQTAIAA